ncbi:MAG: polyprenol monophosphomannose synthase [Patescibacteria group bacterium]|nr:polyprenol monophosphomannose synthase [Patescibacteria group bacterium]MDE1966573.1 polyprenol monophosphomannose synthase [Patescibacteria group bacterium]
MPKPTQKAAVVIPTYNEAGNIGRLIDALCGNVFPSIEGWEMHAVIVDGDSPDGTGRIVEERSALYPGKVHLIKEKGKSGIGAAYLQGFSFAMNELRADAVIEFDADFQHPPEMIPVLLSKLDGGFDYVAGSRRIAGGSEPKDRDLARAFLTRFGGWLARAILFWPGKHFSAVTDPTTGLKATRVEGVLEKLDLRPEHLYSKGFGYKVQLLKETLEAGARYAEVPLRFQNRAAGESKFEPDTTWEVLWACLRTRIKEPQAGQV